MATPEEQPVAEPQAAAGFDVEREAVRLLAYQLGKLHPEATDEQNRLAAEAALREARSESARRAAELSADEATASLMAKIEMSISGRS
jgi:hypothetical protein